MRWNRNFRVRDGDTRIIKRFLVFPVRLRLGYFGTVYETRWLEVAEIVQQAIVEDMALAWILLGVCLMAIFLELVIPAAGVIGIAGFG